LFTSSSEARKIDGINDKQPVTSNMNLIEQFQKRAAEAGLTAEQTQAFIASNNLAEKVAQPTVEDVLAQLCEAANVEKSAEALAYAEGFITKASEAGLPIAQACVVTKQALAHTFPQVRTQQPEKVASATTEADPEKVAYFTGLFEKAAELGFSESQTSEFLQKAAAMAGGSPTGTAGLVASGLSSLFGAGGTAAGAAAGLGAKLKGLLPGGKTVGAGGLGALLGAGGHAAFSKDPGIGDQLLSWIQQNPEAAGGIAGGGLGAVAGGLSGLPGDADPNNPEAGQSHVGRNALLGALAGGGIGAGAGHFAPDMFKRLAA
jgi:hypothetical protein